MKEFVFYAQKRSGHHAVINWLRFQLPGLHVFLNDCKSGVCPLEAAPLRQSRIGWGEKDIRARRMLLYPALRLGMFGTVIYNYEGILPPPNPRSWFMSKSDPVRFIVLRSPANLLASRMKRELSVRPGFDCVNDEVLAKRLHETIKTWGDFARLYLSGSCNSIYYDRWFVDKNYKRQIMESIGVKYREPGRNEIARWGPGSSFDFKTETSGESLDVLNRWKIYRDDPRFAGPLGVEEVKTLVTKIDPDSESTRWITSL